ncbi:ABC transporter permease subunit [Psychrobacillus psychrodurans]|uniref:ABC transporter permease subunit n=1 Tax=Psychrobacillus psychrodurans TaxID=126157 RepID=UPI0008E1BA46|nr:ABC transporter permease subunit [Psychrobacillus psychrodurans]MCZ8540554.1 ABC transporter permease subunit [Psychrobacillus psychrodurans]SFM67737.1 peptide/nickel transport system permease protein [Psychrobacillus psychrodurans]
MKILSLSIQKYILGVVGIILLSCAPILFTLGNLLNFKLFFKEFGSVCKALITPAEWHLSYLEITTMEMIPFSLSSYFNGPYLYSMAILVLALLLSLFVSFFFAVMTTISKGPFKRVMSHFSELLIAIPDFSYIFIFQIAVVQVYLITGYRFVSFYSLGGEVVYVAPILCLSIVPTILFYKLFVALFAEEIEQSYVALAKSKGLSKMEILIRHCTSNVLKSIYHQSKSIVWLTLSSLLIIEHLFGIQGILYYLLNDFSPKGITFILISIFTPFYIFYQIGERIVNKKEMERNALFEKMQVPLLDKKQWKSIYLVKYKKSFKVKLNPFNNFIYKTPLFILLTLLTISLGYFFIYDDHIEQVNFVYNETGKIVSRAPHPPSSNMIFGTDTYGYSILQQLLVGIKYTILLTLIIATIRVVVGYVFGVIYVFFLNGKGRKIINSIADGMHFLPLTLLVFILLAPVLTTSTGTWDTTLGERLFIQIMIMSVIVLPVTTSLIGNEMNDALKKEYVQSSVVMGGSLIWIIIKHLNPQLWNKLLLYWTQHMVQVLQMFVHLGILSIFVGGARRYPDSPWRLVPEIYELSGMISISREVFMTKQYWMIIPPIFVFMLLIYCFNKLAEGIATKDSIKVPEKKQNRKTLMVNEKTEVLTKKTTFPRDYSRVFNRLK